MLLPRSADVTENAQHFGNQAVQVCRELGYACRLEMDQRTLVFRQCADEVATGPQHQRQAPACQSGKGSVAVHFGRGGHLNELRTSVVLTTGVECWCRGLIRTLQGQRM